MPQVCILVAFILLPSLLLLLPASKAVLVWSGAFLQQCLLQSWASVVHIRPLHIHALGQVLPPVLSSYLAGELLYGWLQGWQDACGYACISTRYVAAHSFAVGAGNVACSSH